VPERDKERMWEKKREEEGMERQCTFGLARRSPLMRTGNSAWTLVYMYTTLTELEVEWRDWQTGLGGLSVLTLM
jgi:hypothetical protein